MRRKRTVITGRAAAARAPLRPVPPPPRPAPSSARILPGERIRRASGAAPAVPAPLPPPGVPEPPGPPEVDLSVDLAPSRPGELRLRAPVLVASGAYGYGVEAADAVDLGALGAMCTRGTTLRARTGDPAPRMAETPAGLLNAVGLQNPGVEAVVERYAPVWATWDVPVLVNIAATTVDDFVAIVRRLDAQPGVAGVELNLGCPNAARGGLQFALDPEAAGQVTRAVRAATDLPLLVKLSPGATDVRRVAAAVQDAGADAISAVNTLTGLAIDRDRRRPALGSVYGGLSGPALKPVALRVVYEIAQAVDIPIVGMGGVSSLEDVLDLLLAGASAVGIATAAYADPALPLRLIDELRTWCREQGATTHRGLVGAALPDRRDRASARGAEYRP
jgi:dihydroorotate dehydrogenase (NAD+) catalytic subunit